MNGRFRRSLEEDDGATYHYHINALGEKLHLHVKRNTKFMAPDLMLETSDGNGQRVSRPVSRDAFVTGSVASDPDSVVALSVREGLVRLSMEGHLEGTMLQNESFFAPSKIVVSSMATCTDKFLRYGYWFLLQIIHHLEWNLNYIETIWRIATYNLSGKIQFLNTKTNERGPPNLKIVD